MLRSAYRGSLLARYGVVSWLALALGVVSLRAGSIPDPMAVLTHPAEAEVIREPLTFTWTEAIDAQAYFLWVGSKPGQRDLFQSGETLRTSVSAQGLPRNQVLFARISTKVANTWLHQDSTFSVVAPATLANPTDRAFVDALTELRWEPADHAEAYRISVGSAPGATDYFTSGETTATSVPLPADRLPFFQTLHTRLETKVLGHWFPQDGSFMLVRPASLSRPVDGGDLGVDGKFAWQAVAQADGYFLYIGTKPGALDVYQSGETKLTSISLSKLPVNRTLYARLNTKFHDQWHYRDSTLAVIAPAVLRQPKNGDIHEQLPELAWDPVDRAEAYRIRIGTAPGSSDCFASGETSHTSLLPPSSLSLPFNQPLHVRLETKIQGQWHATSSVFSLVKPAVLTSPAADGILATDRKFSWAPVPHSEGYFLFIGSLPGGRDIYQSGETQLTAVAPSNLPINRVLYARLNTKITGHWISQDREVYIPVLARIEQLAGDGFLETDPLRFSWQPVSEVTTYRLSIGSAPGKNDLFTTGETSAISVLLPKLPANHLLHARLETRILGRWHAQDASFTLARPAVISTPGTDGALGEGRLCQWLPADNADTYFLYVGSTPGARDLYASGETKQTSCVLPILPTNRRLFARLYTKIGDRWIWREREIVAPVKAQLTLPDGASLAGQDPVEFTWSPVGGAEAYRIELGSAPGSADCFASGELIGASVLLPAQSLPRNQTLHAKLETKILGSWYATESRFVLRSIATLSTEPKQILELSPPGNLQWRPVPRAQAYYAKVSRPSSPSVLLYESGEFQQTVITLPPLPQNELLQVQLMTKIDGIWYQQNTLFRILNPATFAKPAVNGVLAKPYRFQWSSAPRAEGYQLLIGTTPQAMDVFVSNTTRALEITAPDSLPTDRQLYAQLRTKLGDRWESTHIAFNVVAPATLMPTEDARGYFDRNIPLSWRAVAGAEFYSLDIGTSPGGKDLFQSGEIDGCSVRLPQLLPVNLMLHARLWTKIHGQWLFRDHTIRLMSRAKLKEPVEGGVLGDEHRFSWDPAEAAEAYRLSVGTEPGGHNLLDKLATTNTSLIVQAKLPEGKVLHARLETKIGGTWHPSDSDFIIPRRATLIYPLAGQVGMEAGRGIEWHAFAGADAYSLSIGSTAGASDLYESGEIKNTQTVVNLPWLQGNRRLYFRLWTHADGHWSYCDTEVLPAAILMAPKPERSVAGAMATFAWERVKGALQYRLQIWSETDGSDMVDTGPISKNRQDLPLPQTGMPLRTRLWTNVSGRWVRNDAVYNPVTLFIHPQTGDKAVDNSVPFEWRAVWCSASYQLEIGRSPGASDVYRSAQIRNVNGIDTICHRVPALPIGVPLYARVVVNGTGRNITSESTFTVTTAGDMSATPMRLALWALNATLQMSAEDGTARLGTRLEFFTEQQQRTTPLCNDYASSLLTMISEFNIGQSRTLNVCLLNNGYDGHTLVEFFNPKQLEWVILDPTFGLTARRRRDGGWATAQDLQEAVRAKNWSSIEYLSADSLTRAYYLDYPLLYLNVQPIQGSPASILPYLTEVTGPVTEFGIYVIKGQKAGTVNVELDGVATPMTITDPDFLTRVFKGTSVKLLPSDSGPLKLFMVNRYVFK